MLNFGLSQIITEVVSQNYKMKQMNYIDIFAGCGGLSLGLHSSKWKGLFAIEKSSMAFETLQHNLINNRKHFQWPKWLPETSHDINEVLEKYGKQLRSLEGTVDLVVGGPPCQGFSMAGRREEADERNELIKSYIRFIETINPNMLLFENVKGFNIGFKKGNMRGEPYSKYVLSELKKLGYDVKGKLVNFSDFGVPQKRERFIIYGTKKGIASDFFEGLMNSKERFLAARDLRSNTSVREAISDLKKSNGVIDSPDSKGFKAGKYVAPKSEYQVLMRKKSRLMYPDSHRFANHLSRTIEKFNFILKSSHKNKNVGEDIREKFNLKKHCIIPLAGCLSSPTLTTLPDDYIHYCEPRILTVREYARIQSFPDWFEFKSKYTSGGKLRKLEVPRYTQIGNAVPPLFGELAGIVLRKIALKRSKNSTNVMISSKNKSTTFGVI